MTTYTYFKGYQLMEWRNQDDWDTAVFFAGQVNDYLWTGLWNRDGHNCTNSDCEGKFVWLSDGAVQDFFDPNWIIEGHDGDELCLRLKPDASIEAKTCDNAVANYICESICTVATGTTTTTSSSITTTMTTVVSTSTISTMNPTTTITTTNSVTSSTTASSTTGTSTATTTPPPICVIDPPDAGDQMTRQWSSTFHPVHVGGLM